MEYQFVHGQLRQKKSLVLTIKCPPRTTRTNDFSTPVVEERVKQLLNITIINQGK